MGITGLLPYLAEATKPCHISEFRGGTVAVDSYCLLHKGANGCADKLARGEDSSIYIDYCMKYVKMFLSYDIHPIMVFDGRNLPAKAETEAKRRESRKKAKQRAVELLKLGKTEEAQTYLKQCVDITPTMAHNLIKECRKLKVDCIVAPYESDAQLAFFNLKGVAECVVTEDSDLILFGCKKVMYKLDLSGSGRLVESDKICSAMKMRPDQFTFEKFRYMCILSGCDYVNSLNGIGLKKAEKFLKLTAETDPEIFLKRIPRYLNMKNLVVTDEYKNNVLIANATFLHQIIFDPYKKELAHLTDPEISGTNPEYLINAGDKFDDEKALEVALGNINPYNFQPYDSNDIWVPSELPQYSIWSGVYKKRTSRKQEKKLQKIKLQEFIQTNSKIEELRIDQEDFEINKELVRYTVELQVKEDVPNSENTEEIQETDVEEAKDLSPVVTRNPFKIKQLSKFPKTYTYGTSVVKSRFFCSESPVEQSKYKDSDNVEECTEILKPCENIIKKRSREDVTEIKSEEIVKQNSEKDFIFIQDSTDTLNKKIKVGRSGSIKKSSVQQKTLHSFFGKLK
ncbi:hypothetical protein ABEB36_010579 [Hypothenemus hampei]|uniref:Exonuclease 1 n=1 Tax=Hypothenemus hampei TaxID=57062 RepID=A0ABD1ECE9_HYPHA